MKLFHVLCLVLMCFPANLLAQEEDADQKRRFYMTWGYNRASYNPSDIHFKGEGFDFTLKNVVARDMPEEWDAKVYLNPPRLTIPQFNFRAGFFIDEKHTISAGRDHMKYKLLSHQLVRIDGFIDPQVFDQYAGKYADELFQITPGFMSYEHSDGFNFVRIGLERREEFWRSKTQTWSAALVPAISAGFMFPWTDFTFMGTRYRNWIHLAGWGVSASVSARFEFKDIVFLQARAHYGKTRLGDILLQDDTDSRASQNITFFERSIVGGVYFGF